MRKVASSKNSLVVDEITAWSNFQMVHIVVVRAL